MWLSFGQLQRRLPGFKPGTLATICERVTNAQMMGANSIRIPVRWWPDSLDLRKSTTKSTTVNSQSGTQEAVRRTGTQRIDVTECGPHAATPARCTRYPASRYPTWYPKNRWLPRAGYQPSYQRKVAASSQKVAGLALLPELVRCRQLRDIPANRPTVSAQGAVAAGCQKWTGGCQGKWPRQCRSTPPDPNSVCTGPSVSLVFRTPNHCTASVHPVMRAGAAGQPHPARATTVERPFSIR